MSYCSFGARFSASSVRRCGWRTGPAPWVGDEQAGALASACEPTDPKSVLSFCTVHSLLLLFVEIKDKILPKRVSLFLFFQSCVFYNGAGDAMPHAAGPGFPPPKPSGRACFPGALVTEIYLDCNLSRPCFAQSVCPTYMAALSTRCRFFTRWTWFCRRFYPLECRGAGQLKSWW